MSHPLIAKLEQLARGWNRRVLFSCAALAVAVTLLTLYAAGLLDFLLKLRDAGLRTILSVIVGGTIVATIVWGSRNIRRLRHSPFGVARQVEDTFPELGDRLASAVAFLRQDEADARSGSAELRRRVISEATATSETVPLSQALELPGERRNLRLFAFALLLLVIALVAMPSLVGTALARLVAPWGSTSWPRDVHLKFVQLPTLVARGDDFEAEVANSTGELPPDTQLEFRFRHDGRKVVERMPAARVGDRLLARRQNVQRSFELRAVGGDDATMQWHQVEVVDPPQLVSSSTQLYPPAYSGIVSTQSERQMRVLAGTRVEWHATANEPIASGLILVAGGERVTIDVDTSDPTQLHVPADKWVAQVTDRAATYSVHLTNQAGLVGESPAYGYTVVADAAPTIAWESEISEEQVTARANVPVTLRAGDDLAVKSVAVVVAKEENEGQAAQLIMSPLFEGGSEPPPLDRLPLVPREAARVAGIIDIEPLDLVAGTRLQLVAKCIDYASAEATTERPKRLAVVSDEEFANLVAGIQQSLLSDLLRALESQRSAQQQSQRLATLIAGENELDRATVDSLIATTVEQRHVGSLLGEEPLGVLPRAESLRERIAYNRFEAEQTVAKLVEIERVIDDLLDEQLPAIEQQLTAARSSLEQAIASKDAGDRTATSTLLTDANVPQREVIAALEALLDELEQWGDTEQFLRELALLEQAQRELAGRAADLASEQMKAAAEGSNTSDLAEQARHLADQQRELARRYRRVEQGLKNLADKPDVSDDLNQRLRDALDEAAERQLARNMSDAAEQLLGGQSARASEVQSQAADDLAELLDLLRNRTPTDPAALAEALRDAAKELDSLRSETQQNANRAEGPQKEQQRQKLADRMERLARQLNRLTAPQAGANTQLAGESMQKEDQPQPEEEADENLAEAQEQLKNRIAQLEQQQEQRALDRLAKELDKLIPRQREVIDRTLTIESKLPGGEEELPRDVVEALSATSELESLLASELRVTIDNISARQVFQLALQGAADDMQRAADRLAENDPGHTTQTAELAALVRMQQVADVLKPPPPADDPPENEQSGGEGGQGEQPPPPVIDLAEVKMLRWMQVELNGRTRQNEAELASSPEVSADQAEYTTRISREQRRLAELVGEMLQRRGPPEQSAPDL